MGTRNDGTTFSVYVEDSADERIIVLRGELDHGCADDARAAIESSMAARCARVVIDLTELRFMDVGGLRLIAWIESRAAAYGATTVVRRPARIVRRLLELSDLPIEIG